MYKPRLIDANELKDTIEIYLDEYIIVGDEYANKTADKIKTLVFSIIDSCETFQKEMEK